MCENCIAVFTPWKQKQKSRADVAEGLLQSTEYESRVCSSENQPTMVNFLKELHCTIFNLGWAIRNAEEPVLLHCSPAHKLGVLVSGCCSRRFQSQPRQSCGKIYTPNLQQRTWRAELPVVKPATAGANWAWGNLASGLAISRNQISVGVECEQLSRHEATLWRPASGVKIGEL